MGWLMAKVYDRIMHGAEGRHFADWRRDALKDVSGEVLEIGAGTGANLSVYGPGLSRLVLLEPDPHMRVQLGKKLMTTTLAATGLQAELAEDAGECLPYEDASFDWVVSTLVLCSVANTAQVLSELHRVLRPGGKLAFVEHVLDSSDETNRRRQLRWQPLWGLFASHCQVTRDTALAISSAGFEMGSLEHSRMSLGPKIVRPVIRGYATRPNQL